MSHDRTAFSFGFVKIGSYCPQFWPAGPSLGGPRGLVAFHILVALVDAGQSGHVKNVPHAVLRLQGRALQIWGRDLLGHV